MRLLFIDAKSSEAYDLDTLNEKAVGGTEGTLLRVAAGLSRSHQVYVAQLGRKESRSYSDNLTFISVEESRDMSPAPEVVIILRKHRLVKPYSKIYPKAKLVLWLANFQKREVLVHRHWLIKTGCRVICMSRHHRDHSSRILNGSIAWLFRIFSLQAKRLDIDYIYNIIDIEPFENVAKNNNKLLFMSTANKGLIPTLKAFKVLYQRFPELELYIAGTSMEGLKDPKAEFADLINQPGIKLLGKLPHAELMRHTQESMCVFYPQAQHPETFGIIYAEANAVGTPVLAHDFGSAAEVLSSSQQLINGRDINEVIERVSEWKTQGPPQVSAREEFRSEAVIAQWQKLLQELASS